MSFPTQVPNARLVHQFSNRRQWAGSERQKSERGLKLQGFQPFHRRGPKPNIIAARPLRAERHVFATRFCLFVCLFVCLCVCLSAFPHKWKAGDSFVFSHEWKAWIRGNSLCFWISPDFFEFLKKSVFLQKIFKSPDFFLFLFF